MWKAVGHVQATGDLKDMVLCSWCGFYSPPMSSCEHCGSPIRAGKAIAVHVSNA